jgi:diketogulonate reductase-like aldo/keto reductase
LHPRVGFGTYKVGYIPPSASAGGSANAFDPELMLRVFKDAIDVGYSFFDCAQFYNNEKQVGDALKGVPRSKLFLASKVWTDKIYEGPDAVRAQVQKTLDDLQTDYLDLYLIHWPVPGKHIEAYKVLEQLKKEGKVKSIGLSNYTIEDYEELKPHVTIKPTINQIEVNPFLYRKKTIDYFQKEGVAIQAYRALRQGQEMNNQTLLQIANKYNKSIAQVMGKWCIQKDIIFIPKTLSKQRMIENLNIFDFTLSDEDIKYLDSLTVPQSLESFKILYQKCVIRDTPLTEGVKSNITVD